MSVLCSADVTQGDIVLEEAHLEGSLLAYVFLAQALTLDGLGVIDEMPCPRSVAAGESVYAQQDYRRVLLAGRVLVAVLDLVAILVVFYIARRLTSPWPSLVAASIFATLPFEAIHAHYMRAHTPSNLAILLVLLASLGLAESQTRRRIVISGFLCGLAAAIRYTSAVTMIVPGLMIASRYRRLRRGGETADGVGGREVSRRLSLLGGAAFGGFVITQPPLFLAFSEAMEPVAELLAYVPTEQFSGAGLLDWSKIWAYVTYLLPHAVGPGFYALFVASTVYVVFLRRYYAITLPWMAMNAVYLFFMAKGYVEPVFARAVLNLLPVLVLSTAIATQDALERFRSARERAGLALAFVGCLGWTLVFDGAYLRAMTGGKDARYRVAEHLRATRSDDGRTIGVFEDNESGYFTTLPAMVVGPEMPRLRSAMGFNAVEPDLKAVVVAGYMDRYRTAEERVADLAENHSFTLALAAVPEFAIFAVTFDHRDLPADMQYPFVELFVLAPEAPRSGIE